LKNIMNEAGNGKTLRKYRILVAPLDWGLGHATRCIPIIKELLANDYDVFLAGEGAQEALLRSEFPDLPFLKLGGYQVSYSKSPGWFVFNMILQAPRIISVIRSEHRWLKRMVKAHKIDAVISDNRFGLYHSKVPSVLITHQLYIKTGLGKWSERLLQRLNYRYINRFTECWVPDAAGENNLGGELSNPAIKPRVPTRYIGPVSRFETRQSTEIKDHVLFILSGPEPQRTIFENRIINEVSHYAFTATIVRGLPLSPTVLPSTGMIKFHNHLQAAELNNELAKAEWVICRSGYSTVMDLVKMQKKSIMVPTPGQTEQEYLASYLGKKQITCMADQKNFSLSAVLEQAGKFRYKIYSFEQSVGLREVIREFVKRITIKKDNH
jgi:uncharacterized protein (TIGR00661 family)